MGITAREASDKGWSIRTERFSLGWNGKAVITGEMEGYVELICDAHTGQLLGAEMVGPHVTELIDELVLALRLEATVEELKTTIHAHPTLSEAIWETARLF